MNVNGKATAPLFTSSPETLPNDVVIVERIYGILLTEYTGPDALAVAVSVDVPPAQINAGAADADTVGKELTVTKLVTLHVPAMYVIVTTPNAMPITTPVESPAAAILVSLLVHVPPAVASVNVIVDPWQILDPPDIAAGTALMVTVVVA